MKYFVQKCVPYLFFLFMGPSSFCQTETFDIATYIPPHGWTKNLKQDVVTYTTIDNSKGSFCVLAIYSATGSHGTPQKDFENEWKALVATPYKTVDNPRTETQTTGDGWKAVVGAATATQDSKSFYAILTVFSGFGKVVSVLITLNDQSYMGLADTLLDHIKLDKNAVIGESTPANRNNQAINNGISIIGVWSDHASAIGNYVTASGAFVGSADVNSMEEYSFKSNSVYTYKFFGMSNSRLYYTETNGTYKITGVNLVLTPEKRKGGYNGAIHEEANWLGKPETLQFYIGANKWEAGPFLNLHKDGNYYSYPDYPYNYYKKLKEN